MKYYSEIDGRPAEQTKQFGSRGKAADSSWCIEFISWPKYWIYFCIFLRSVLEKVQILSHTSITSLPVLAGIINAIYLIFVLIQQHPNFGPNTIVNFVIKNLSKVNTTYILQLSNHIWKTAVCHNSHNSSEWDSGITRHHGYKNTSCQNFMSTKNCFSQYFRKNVTCLIVGLPRIVQVFSLSCKNVYRWVTTNFSFTSDSFPFNHFFTHHCTVEFYYNKFLFNTYALLNLKN